MDGERFFVTGALGCIGSWVIRELVASGTEVVATDLNPDFHRLRLLLSEQEIADLTFHQLDVTDGKSVNELVAALGVTHIIHLAGLQVPDCKANPSQGARVNVVGTINVFEAARHSRERVRGLCYASSVAVLGPPEVYSHSPIPDNAELLPATLYGVFKQANEHTARVYWKDWGLGSVGLRPYIVYGVGRDRGLTSDIAKALLAAAAERSYRIQFGGRVALQYAKDVAQTFIQAARSEYPGAAACNLRNDEVEVAEFVSTVRQLVPTPDLSFASGHLLPFPSDLDDSGLRSIIGNIPSTGMKEACSETIQRFRELLRSGRIELAELEGGNP